MLTIHNFFSPVTYLTLTPALLTSRMLFKLYFPGCPPACWLLTLHKLNFSLDSNNNSLKLTPVHLTQYTLLVILASFLMNILLILTRYLFFLNSDTHIFVSFAASIHILISKQPAPLLPQSFTLSLATATHCSLYCSLPEYQLNRLQFIQNSLSRAVVRASKSSHIALSLLVCMLA